ncbi:MAG TPA: 3-isopropylmalate dehydratase large subunit [Methanosarcinales archaeon]|nr:3-isopropylmalate dehydratase large subunit [Methanosarcinales archaeon]
MPTISEKIFSRASNTKNVHANDFVVADIDYAMAHDGTSVLAVKAFKDMGMERVWNPDKIIIFFDHIAPANSELSAKLHKKIRNWTKDQGIKNFYDIGDGICHQLLPEKGFALPGKLIVGADSHSCTYGAFGAFGTGVGATDMAEIWASGKLWFRVPETIKVTVDGELKKGVSAKDIALRIIKEIGSNGATYKAIEYYGESIKDLSIEGRMTLCNMSIEMGAKTGIVPADNKTLDFLKYRAIEPFKVVHSDKSAEYVEEYYFEVSDLEPQIACPFAVDNVKPISEVSGKPVDQVFIGSCTNGRYEDLVKAAQILKDKKVKVRTIIIPASRETMLKIVETGIASILLRSGAVIANPGCGPCLGAHLGVISDSEVCISTSNRNFKGRMGSGGFIYLASPETAAASALSGEIRASDS